MRAGDVVLLFRAMRTVWHWPAVFVVVVGGTFLAVDASFFGANLLKIADGGWLPLIVALGVFTVMMTWRMGIMAIKSSLPLSETEARQFVAELERGTVPRIGDNTIVFLTRTQQQVSKLVVDYARLMQAMPRNVIALHVVFEHVPRVMQPSCHVLQRVADGFWRLEAPIQRVTGWDTPYPHAFEWEYFPGPARIAAALKSVMEAA